MCLSVLRPVGANGISEVLMKPDRDECKSVSGSTGSAKSLASNRQEGGAKVHLFEVHIRVFVYLKHEILIADCENALVAIYEDWNLHFITRDETRGNSPYSGNAVRSAYSLNDTGYLTS
jgi:hypothetical protein